MLKAENIISLNIPKSNNVDLGINSDKINNKKNEQNNEYLYSLAFKLEKIILHSNYNINKIYSELKNLVLLIYKTINENNRIIKKSNNNFKKLSSLSMEKEFNSYSNEPNCSNNSDELNKKIEKYSKDDVYKRDFKNDVKEGNGIKYYKNGYINEGEWKNGKRDGKGKYFKINENSIEDLYEDEFKNVVAEGNGVSYYKNGDKYEDKYKAWNREGKRTYYYNNGDIYEGEFKKEYPEGKGRYVYKNGNIYEGEFKNGQAEGKGIFYYKYGKNKGDKYIGDFKRFNKDGKGIYYYKNGDRYEGDWKNDKKEGQGVFYYKNGDRIMGNYIDNKPIGKHVMLYTNEKILEKTFLKPNNAKM